MTDTTPVTPPPPPRLTGNSESDLLALLQWVWEFYRTVIAQGYLATSTDVEQVQENLDATLPLVATSGGTGIISYTKGDLIVASAANTLDNFPAEDIGKVLKSAGIGELPTWGQVDLSGGEVTGALPESHGGTNQTTYTIGAMLYASALNTLATLAAHAGADKRVMQMANSVPSWGVTQTQNVLSEDTTVDADCSYIVSSYLEIGASANLTVNGNLEIL